MKTMLKKAAAKVTRKRIVWVVKVNVLGWVIQGVIAGGLVLAGMELAPAALTAKVANWVVFLGQLAKAALLKA